MTPVSVTSSLVSKVIAPAVAGTAPSAGVEETIDGAVLSIRMPPRTLVPWLPSESTASARMS